MHRSTHKQESLARLGECIRRRRKILRMTQTGLAEATKFHRNYIASIERGEGNITMLNLIKLAEGLGIRPSTLMRQAGH